MSDQQVYKVIEKIKTKCKNYLPNLIAEPQSIAGDVSSQNYYASPFSSGGAAFAGIAPAYPSPFAHKYPAFGLTTTIRYQSNAQPTFATEIAAEAGEELDGGYQQESSSFNPDNAEEEPTNGN